VLETLLCSSGWAIFILTYHACDAPAGFARRRGPVSRPGGSPADRMSTQTKYVPCKRLGHVGPAGGGQCPAPRGLSRPRAPGHLGSDDGPTSIPESGAWRRPARPRTYTASRTHFAFHSSAALEVELIHDRGCRPTGQQRRPVHRHRDARFVLTCRIQKATGWSIAIRAPHRGSSQQTGLQQIWLLTRLGGVQGPA